MPDQTPLRPLAAAIRQLRRGDRIAMKQTPVGPTCGLEKSVRYQRADKERRGLLGRPIVNDIGGTDACLGAMT